MNKFVKQTDPKKTCDGCNSKTTRESAFGYCCAECESYLAAYDAMRLNLAVHLERWRHRHGLTRKAARKAAQELLSLDDKWIDAAMDGYSWTEIRTAQEASEKGNDDE